jgi:hypothetical protein
MSEAAVLVAREALATVRAALPTYGSRWSRHDHMQPQPSSTSASARADLPGFR